jgi:plasmid stabilization system protein ParE
VKVALTERAYTDLIRLTDFLLEFDKSAASKAIDLIEDGLRILKQHPFIGRPVQGDQAIEGDLAKQATLPCTALKMKRRFGF